MLLLYFFSGKEWLDEAVFIKMHHSEINSILLVEAIGIQIIKNDVVFWLLLALNLSLFFVLINLLRSISKWVPYSSLHCKRRFPWNFCLFFFVCLNRRIIFWLNILDRYLTTDLFVLLLLLNFIFSFNFIGLGGSLIGWLWSCFIFFQLFFWYNDRSSVKSLSTLIVISSLNKSLSFMLFQKQVVASGNMIVLICI